MVVSSLKSARREFEYTTDGKREERTKLIFMIDDISANLNFQKEPSRVKNCLAKCRKTVNL